MRIKAQIGLTVGPASGNHWGQVLVTPAAYGIVEISDASEGAQQKGARILSHLGELLSHELTSLTAVEQAADSVWESGITSLIILVPVGRVVYLVLRGVGGVFVKRGMELAKLLHTQGGVSGEVRQGDTILLVSERFLQVLSREDIMGVFDHLSAAEVAEKLTIRLHEQPGGEGAVALVFEVEHFEDSEAAVSNLGLEPAEIDQSRPTNMDISAGVAAGGRGSFFNLMQKNVASFWNNMRALPKDPKRLTRTAAIVVSALFLISVIAGVWKQTSARKNKQVTVALSDARHAFEEGVALLELNPVKGRERLTVAKALLEPWVATVNTRTREGRDVQALYSQIGDNLTQSLQISEAPLSLFYDMELLKQGARAASFALEGTSLVVADTQGGTIYRLDIATKKAGVVAGGEQVTGVSSVVTHGDLVYALTTSGIVSTKGSEKSVLSVPAHESWGNISSLVSFGGNLYLLDIGTSRIWKYVATEKGFSDIREYLNADTLPDLSAATNMTIDGTVWVGTKKGSVMHFVQGREETFLPKGVEPALGTDLLVYATDETKNMYIADRSNNRVVVLDHDGIYLAQYRFTSDSPVGSIAVSEAQKKILLLSGGKIYSIDLK